MKSLNKDKARTLNRLRIIEGQVRGLARLISENKYCVDVIHQSLAIKKALSSFEDFVLEKHLSTHVVEQIKTGQESKAIKEILAIYRLSKKK